MNERESARQRRTIVVCFIISISLAVQSSLVSVARKKAKGKSEEGGTRAN
jgi:hypothetical protein